MTGTEIQILLEQTLEPRVRRRRGRAAFVSFFAFPGGRLRSRIRGRFDPDAGGIIHAQL